MMRDPSTPTMGDTGVLANITISEGGRAEGSLGQASALRALVRKLTPKKALGEASEGAIFGGGRLFLGEGVHQESLKMLAKSELVVYRIPAEQLYLLDKRAMVAEIRNYLAFQLTYWFSRCNMIDKWVRDSPSCSIDSLFVSDDTGLCACASYSWYAMCCAPLSSFNFQPEGTASVCHCMEQTAWQGGFSPSWWLDHTSRGIHAHLWSGCGAARGQHRRSY
jgi:hypothetical protein